MSAEVFSTERVLRVAAIDLGKQADRQYETWDDYVCKTFFPSVVDIIATIWNREEWGRPIKDVNLRDPATQFYQHKEGNLSLNFKSYEVGLYLEEADSFWFDMDVSLMVDDPEGILHVELEMDKPHFICWDPTAMLQEVTNSIGRKIDVYTKLGSEERQFTLIPEVQDDQESESHVSDVGSANVIVT